MAGKGDGKELKTSRYHFLVFAGRYEKAQLLVHMRESTGGIGYNAGDNKQF